jgi:hypothetical protein
MEPVDFGQFYVQKMQALAAAQQQTAPKIN